MHRDRGQQRRWAGGRRARRPRRASRRPQPVTDEADHRAGGEHLGDRRDPESGRRRDRVRVARSAYPTHVSRTAHRPGSAASHRTGRGYSPHELSWWASASSRSASAGIRRACHHPGRRRHRVRTCGHARALPDAERPDVSLRWRHGDAHRRPDHPGRPDRLAQARPGAARAVPGRRLRRRRALRQRHRRGGRRDGSPSAGHARAAATSTSSSSATTRSTATARAPTTPSSG